VRVAATALLIAALAPGVSGCAARQQFLERVHGSKAVVRLATLPTAGTSLGDGATLTALTELPPPSGVYGAPELPTEASPRTPVSAPVSASAPMSARGGAVPAGMQFLYGSGEAVALDMQAFLGLNDLIVARADDKMAGHEQRSVVLSPDATLASPTFLPCGDKPLAVIFDVDETALLNLGYEASEARTGAPYDPERWDRWEKTGVAAVEAMPGLAGTKLVAEVNKVRFVFNTNRSVANAAQTEKALNGAGLGPAVHGDTLWLQGDAGSGSGKDARRAAIAQKYCVIAMVGDQLGDFSDLFNAVGATPAARRALAGGRAIKTLWGHGWFILPNPVYGTALKGGIDDVFPADKRWTDTEGVK